jgi:uncharacterized protein (DUF433 family)
LYREALAAVWKSGSAVGVDFIAGGVKQNREWGYDGREEAKMATATLDWSDCPLVEIIPGKVSGAPLLKNTRLPVEAITGNYDAFREEGLSPEEAIVETLDCYPEAGRDAVEAILNYRAEHELQVQF